MVTDKTPLTPPRYAAEASSFGVLSHVAPVLDTLHEFDRGLRDIERQMDEPDLRFDFRPDFSGGPLANKTISQLDKPGLYYGWVLGQGRRLVEGIARTEGAHAAREQALRTLITERERRVDELNALIARIPERQALLTNAAAAWRQAASDYAMAQRLLREDWQDVEDLDEARTRTLRGATGLFYVRVRAECAELPLADPLALRGGDPGGLVPGCGEPHGLPDELETFFEVLLECPLASFARLQPLLWSLPDRSRIDWLLQRRDGRRNLAATVRLGPGIVSAAGQRLQSLTRVSQSVLQGLLQRPVARNSLREYHREVAGVLGLADALTGTSGPLRARAETVRGEMEQVIGCAVARLQDMPPALRFEWATMAEADTLVVREPERWPGMFRLEGARFTAARTLVDCVHWLMAQIGTTGDRDGVGEQAMATLIRAAVIVAAHGDPTAGIRGQVVTAPPRVEPGVRIRVLLNREALLGTRLDLLDPEHRQVGEVEIEDHDDLGSVARIVRVASKVALTSRFAVQQRSR